MNRQAERELTAMIGKIRKRQPPGWTISRLNSLETVITSPRGMVFVKPERSWTAEHAQTVLDQLKTMGVDADLERLKYRPEAAATSAPVAFQEPTTDAVPAETDQDVAPRKPKFIKFDYPEEGQRLGLDVLLPPEGGDDGPRTLIPNVIVTPEIARAFLERTALQYNRRARASNTRNFKKLMSGNLFQHTHQGFAFNQAGEFTDGQHRAQALVEIGEEFPDAHIVVDITYNMPTKTAFAFDGGAKRSNADHVQVAGISDANVVSRLVRLLYNYRETQGRRPNWKDVEPLTPQELIEWGERYGEALAASWQAIKPKAPAKGLKPLKGLNLNCAAIWHFLAVEAWPEAPVEEFMAGLAEMEWSYPDDPRKAFYRWVTNLSERRVDQRHHLANLITVYNDWCLKEPRKNIKWLPQWGIPAPYAPQAGK